MPSALRALCLSAWVASATCGSDEHRARLAEGVKAAVAYGEPE